MTVEDATQSQSYSRATAFTGTDPSYSPVTDAVLIGVAGNLKVDMAGGDTGLTLALTAGIHRLRVSKIYTSGTTATGVFALFAK